MSGVSLGKRRDSIKGSCRSNGAINLVEFMRGLPIDLLDDLGGHALSAGFSIAESKIGKLKEEITNYTLYSPSKKLTEVIHIDKEISIDDVGGGFFSMIENFNRLGWIIPSRFFLLRIRLFTR